MSLTFDPANFRNLKPPNVPAAWGALFDFYARYADRIPYAHIKSIGPEGIAPAFRVSDEREAACIRRMWERGTLICIELPEQGEPAQTKGNILDAKERITGLLSTGNG